MSKPIVSILTPTYNRREFLPILIEMVKAQTYDLKKCEWIIIDDSPESNEDLFAPLVKMGTVNVRYHHYSGEKLILGAKRNMLNEWARGEYLVAFDDDDYHCPERISHSVTMLNKFKAHFAGNSMLYIYFSDDDKIWVYDGDHGASHFTNGTAAYRRSYLDSHKYDSSASSAEESSFSNGYEKPIVQLDSMRTILVKAHPGNTVDKRFTRRFNPSMKVTALKLRNFIKDAKVRDEFREMAKFNGEPIRIPENTAKMLLEAIAANQPTARTSACTDE
jgi:glycosyltransferase involved in cell wall biosynthesis